MIAFIRFEELNFHENKAIYNSLLLQNKSRYMNAFELIIRFVSSNTVMTHDRNFVTYQRCNWTRLNEWRHSGIMIGLFFKYFLFYQTSSAHSKFTLKPDFILWYSFGQTLVLFFPSYWICLLLILFNFCYLVIQFSGTFDKPWKLTLNIFFLFKKNDSFRKLAIFSVNARAPCLLSLYQ